jgi:hypothetical protein
MKTIAEMFEGDAHNLVCKNRFNEIIDMVYNKYDELFDSYYPPFSAPYPKRLTKEELVEEIKNGGKVIQEYELGVKIEERVLSFKERKEILRQEHPLYFMEQQLGGEDIFIRNNIPTKEITITYNNETISYYE